MPRILRTDRLCLRAPGVDDAAAIFAFAGDPEVTKFLDWPTHETIDDSYALVEDVQYGWEAGDDYGWVLERRDRTVDGDDAVIGSVGCQFDAHGAEFGYVLAREGWGQGLATEAMRAVLAAAREIDDVYRFWASCDVDNSASLRVLEKLGMTREGRLRCWSERPNLTADGRPRDVFVYAWVR